MTTPRGSNVFDPAYQALVKLGRSATATEVGDQIGRSATTVMNAFSAHIRKARSERVAPMVVKVQNGVFAVNTEKAPAPDAPPSKPKAEDEIYERIAITGKGTIIVRGCDTRTIYRLTEMDF